MTEFSRDPNLEKIAKEITRLGPIPEAAGANYRIVFSDEDPKRKAGQCAAVKGALHFLTGLEYVITIYREKFDVATEEEKLRVICHELYHITTDEKGAMKIREHEGDFCELPEHDNVNRAIARALVGKIPEIRVYSRQATIEVEA